VRSWGKKGITCECAERLTVRFRIVLVHVAREIKAWFVIVRYGSVGNALKRESTHDLSPRRMGVKSRKLRLSWA
jgi:hypothetical protein